MKNFMRILSILVAFTGIILVITFIDQSNANSFQYKLFIIALQSLLPIISIAICAYCMERNDTNYLVRIIPIYSTIPIVLSIINVMFDIKTGFTVDLFNFFSCTFLEIVGLSLIFIVKPNNIITTYIRYLAIGLFILTVISSLTMHYSSTNISIDGYGSFNVGILTLLTSDVLKLYAIATMAQIFTILCLYISNYAFSDKVEIEAEDIDYDVVKEEAKNLANAQMNEIYNLTQKNNVPDRSASDKGLMNVNNQLAQNSNVGTVNEQARQMNVQGSSLDSLMPLSKGPVVNETMQEKKEVVVDTTPQVETKVEETIPPNLDIQEQMRLRAQEQNQNNINQ